MSNGDSLTSYEEIVSVIQALPLLVREKRRAKGLSLRAAALDSGVEFATFRRFENGADIMHSTAVQLLMWVGVLR